MMMYVHFNETTGDIVAWGDGQGSSPYLPGHGVIEIAKRPIDPKVHKVDIASRIVVNKTRDELMAALRVDVTRQIERELLFTDMFANVPPDRPRVGEFAFDWLPYRETLRRLSDLPTPVDMIDGWPFRPDNTDPIPDLRKRI